MNGEKESLEKSSPLGKHTTIMMTGEESARRSTPDREKENDQGLVNLVVHPWEVSNHCTVVRVVREVK